MPTLPSVSEIPSVSSNPNEGAVIITPATSSTPGGSVAEDEKKKLVKRGLAQMFKGGVIMDVMNPEQVKHY